MRLRSPLSLLALAALVLPACGAEKTEIPASAVPAGDPGKTVRYPRAGLRASVPAVADVLRRRPPAVFRAAVGEAVVGAFAYRRREQLPRDAAELRTARRRLVVEARRRGRGRRFRLIRSRETRVAGARAVELLGEQTISRARLRTRSLHVFKGRGEYAIDMHAPVREFRRADRTFFAPLARSLRVSGRIRPQPRPRRRR